MDPSPCDPSAPAGGAPAHATRRGWAMWGVGAAFYLVAVFHRMALGVAGLTAQEHLHVGHGALASFTALQFAVYLVMQVPAGLAADRIGPRRTLAAGLACMAAGEVVFAQAGSLPAGLAGRALIGLGDALTLLNVLRLAHSWLPGRLGPLIATLTGAVGALGQLFGTIPLRAALDAFGWEATFTASAVATAVLFVAALAVVRDHPPGVAPPGRREHLPVLATLRGCWERPGTRHGFWVHMGLFCPFQVVTALWGVPFLVQGQGLSTTTAATYLSVLIATFAVGSPVAGALAGRGERTQDRLVLGLNAAVLVPWAAVLLWPGGEAPRALLLGAFVACGAAAAGGMVAFDIGRRGTPSLAVGSATALVNCGGFLAGIVCLEAVGLLLGERPTATHYQVALAPMLACSALGMVMAARSAASGSDGRRPHTIRSGQAPTPVPSLSLHTTDETASASRTFVVHGDLDLTTTAPLLRAAREAVASGVRRLVLDLRRLSFVDSSGMHALALIDYEQREAGGETLFVRAAPTVHRAFEVVGLDARLAFADLPR